MTKRFFCCAVMACVVVVTAGAKQKPQKVSTVPAADTSKVLLCADTAADGTKLVYTYVNGKKTECMREQELMTLLGRNAFDSDTAFKRDQSDQVLGKDVYAEIQKGNKSPRDLDLRGRDLMKVDFSGKDLHGLDFRGSDLRQANLEGADLRGSDLRGAFLMKTNLKKARLDSANLESAYLMKADLSSATGLTLEMLKTTVSLFDAVMDSSLLAKAKEAYPEKFKSRNDHWKSKDRPESEGSLNK